MSNSYTPASASFGRRIRITYIAVLVLLFAARMWTVHGVHEFLELDAGHGKTVNIAGQLRSQSAAVMHAAFVQLYAPQMAASEDGVETAIGAWIAQHTAVAGLLARCAPTRTPCRHFQALEAQMRDVVAGARAALLAPPGDRAAALAQLTARQLKYGPRPKPGSRNWPRVSRPTPGRNGTPCVCGPWPKCSPPCWSSS